MRIRPGISLFSYRISLFPTFATVKTGHYHCSVTSPHTDALYPSKRHFILLAKHTVKMQNFAWGYFHILAILLCSLGIPAPHQFNQPCTVSVTAVFL